MLAFDLFGVREMLAQDFMRNAFIAGTAIALASGCVGYFVVLRNQVFSGDALSHVAFTGSMGAIAFGYDARLGLFGGVIAVALLMGALGTRGHADDVVIGGVFAWVLGLGVLFLSVFTTNRSAADGGAGTTVLFGSIVGGLDHERTVVAVVIATVVCAIVIGIARPLLFASVDAAVAAAAGVPVRALGYAFLVLVALTAAEATQAIGALLLLALLAAPGAAAARLTTRPFVALALSAALSVGATWAGLVVSYWFPSLPASFTIVAALVTVYVVSIAFDAARRLGSHRRETRGRMAAPCALP